MKETEDKLERYTIQSIDKALDLIELLADRGSLSLIELTELLNQPKSSTYRIVLTLENRGFISRSDEDGKYCLGYKQLLITKNLLERNNIRTAALPEMKKLSELFGDTVNLGVLLEGEIMYLEIIESIHALRMTDSVGSKSPFHATAMGKAILAYLPEKLIEQLLTQFGLPAITPQTITSKEIFHQELEKVRCCGYAIDDQEIVEGARCVASPIFGMFGHVYGAISVSGPMHRYSDDKIPELSRHVSTAAASVSLKLGHENSLSPSSRAEH
ncbi:helix-turn-helix domain-containing protein [Paenibacillus sp. LMG 31456]|uniref:Helix-turn-helix domain-containing protein n=1 Tax=Paenibacillus foliorum TaxID=2654974 RepID=A0A972K4M2_9BACL|nr:IclR family transcriptional regulator [Paenibacillus foliorum]NOU96157.1 helix-turn-helix domain-containing protein [Paenibacillus foliorum]